MYSSCLSQHVPSQRDFLAVKVTFQDSVILSRHQKKKNERLKFVRLWRCFYCGLASISLEARRIGTAERSCVFTRARAGPRRGRGVAFDSSRHDAIRVARIRTAYLPYQQLLQEIPLTATVRRARLASHHDIFWLFRRNVRETLVAAVRGSVGRRRVRHF